MRPREMEQNNTDKIRARDARLPHVERMLLHGYSEVRIRSEILALGVQKTYSPSTVHSDVQLVKATWAAEQRADREDVLTQQMKSAQERNSELWQQWSQTRNPACLAEIRHNDEHIANLLQLGKQDKTNIYNHTSNYIVSSQKTVDAMAQVKKKGG